MEGMAILGEEGPLCGQVGATIVQAANGGTIASEQQANFPDNKSPAYQRVHQEPLNGT